MGHAEGGFQRWWTWLMICWLQNSEASPSLASAALKHSREPRARQLACKDTSKPKRDAGDAMDPLHIPSTGYVTQYVAKRRRRVLGTQFTECIYTAPPQRRNLRRRRQRVALLHDVGPVAVVLLVVDQAHGVAVREHLIQRFRELLLFIFSRYQ